ncbi:hypothetical protein Sste5346_000554 [Sporothrix stenoceras]|uniref:ZZ-type domain-containing protein n=1 Tax=Sporothrix stenoceras TaxID=5173 RepID=A0ABR3ZSS4_9PEZI
MDKNPFGNTPWADEEVVDPGLVFGKEPLKKFAKALVATCPSKKYRAQYESLIVEQCGYDTETIKALRTIVEKDLNNPNAVIPDSITKDVIWDTIARNIEDAFRVSPLWVKVAIGWLVHTLKPFTQEELRSGVQLSTYDHSVPPVVPTLKAIYGPVIYATSKRICFPNERILGYFRDCLSKEKSRLGPDWANLQIPDNNAIANVLTGCIAQESSLLKTPLSMLYLKQYAAEYWRRHLEEGPTDAAKVCSLAEDQKFMQVQRKMEYNFYWTRYKRTKKLRMDGPLVLAVQVGNPSIVASILQETKSAEEVGSAVTMAARYNFGEIVEILLAEHKPPGGMEEDAAMDAALEIAAMHNCSAVYKPVLSWMDKYTDARPKAYHAELLSHVACHAAMLGYLDLLKFVVQSHGAQVNVPILGVVKPLQQAVYYGNAGCAKFLVQEAGAIIYNTKPVPEDDGSHDTASMSSEEGKEDENPLIIAAEQGFKEILTILLDQTAVRIKGHTNGESTVSCDDASDDASDTGNAGDAGDTEGAKDSRKKCLVPWSFIEDALVAACKQSDAETVKHILEHPTVKAVPKSRRPVNSELLSSAIRAQLKPGPDSLAMLILKASKPAESRDDLVHPFVRAAEFGQLEFVRYCLELNDPNAAMAFVNGSDEGDKMALHCAANQGHIDIVRCLLEKNADPNVSDGSGSTPLALAAVSGHAETVHLLLENGADVSWVGPTTIGILASATMSRACELDVSVIRLLLKYGASVNALDNSKHTALHWAAQRGYINILEVLLTQDGIDVTMTGDRDMNALHSAAQSTARTAVIAAEMLIEAGISTQKADVDGWLPLHLAACWNGVDLMQFLLSNDKSKLNARTTNGDTVLHAAYKTPEVLIWLLDQGFDLDMENSEGRTVLMHAAKNGVDESVGLLLAFGASTDSLDRSNRSALHHAVETRSLTVANRLLDANPAVLFQVDSSGTSVLYTAITRVLMPFALRVLNELEKYAKENNIQDDMIRILNAETANTQRSPLVLAARRGDKEVVAKMVKLGADIEKRDYRQLTALTYAIERNDDTIVRLLLEAHLKLNKERKKMEEERKAAAGQEQQSQDDTTKVKDMASAPAKTQPAPLQSAAGAGNVDMVKLVLSYGVDVNEESGQFNTALTAAAARGFSRVVSTLLNHRADPTLGGGSYPNALCAAVSSTSVATIDLLLAKDKSAVLARDIQGRNALLVAVQSRALDAFERVLGVAESLSDGGKAMPFGTALDPDKQGRRLLHFAASSGDVDVLRYFLEHPRLQLKNDIDIPDNDGWTPLHWACRLEEGAEVVELLLACGSDPSLETRDGWTPLNIAQYHDAVGTLPAINVALHERAHTIPIIGACYKCEDCEDYDLCFKCHWSAKSTHYAGHKWKLRDGTEDPGDSRRPPYGAREVNRVRSRVRSRESAISSVVRMERMDTMYHQIARRKD